MNTNYGAWTLSQGETPPSDWRQCPGETRTGRPCLVEGERRRGGWCHLHDPDGGRPDPKADAATVGYRCR